MLLVLGKEFSDLSYFTQRAIPFHWRFVPVFFELFTGGSDQGPKNITMTDSASRNMHAERLGSCVPYGEEKRKSSECTSNAW